MPWSVGMQTTRASQCTDTIFIACTTWDLALSGGSLTVSLCDRRTRLPCSGEEAHLQTLTTRLCFGIRGSTLSQTARVPAKLVASVVAASFAPKVLPLKAMPACAGHHLLYKLL